MVEEQSEALHRGAQLSHAFPDPFYLDIFFAHSNDVVLDLLQEKLKHILGFVFIWLSFHFFLLSLTFGALGLLFIFLLDFPLPPFLF